MRLFKTSGQISEELPFSQNISYRLVSKHLDQSPFGHHTFEHLLISQQTSGYSLLSQTIFAVLLTISAEGTERRREARKGAKRHREAQKQTDGYTETAT